MSSSRNCDCSVSYDHAQEKLTDLNRLVKVMLDTNPHYSAEVSSWINSALDYLANFNALLGTWDKAGCLDLTCRACHHTINPLNNSSSEEQNKSENQVDLLAQAFGTLQLDESQEES